MKTTEHGIEDSKDIENMHHMRLMTLLQELVRDKGFKGAARVLELDQRTVAECARTGQLSRRVRQALERALQEGVGSAAARQRERNDRLESRVSRSESGASDAGRKPSSTTRERREYPDLVTLEPAPEDEEVFGDAWPLIVEWRGLKDAHPNDGRGLAWLAEEERLRVVELALLEDHGMTLPPEKRPLRGFDRDGQINWRRTALFDTRRAIRKRELLNRLSLGLLWR